MSVQKIVVVSVPVTDPVRARHFYVEALGLDVIRDDSSVPGMHWIEVAPRGTDTALTLVTWFDTMPPGSLQGLVLASDDVTGDHARLSALGVEFEQAPEVRPYGVEAVVRDPDGNRLVLLQRSSNEWTP